MPDSVLSPIHDSRRYGLEKPRMAVGPPGSGYWRRSCRFPSCSRRCPATVVSTVSRTNAKTPRGIGTFSPRVEFSGSVTMINVDEVVVDGISGREMTSVMSNLQVAAAKGGDL